MVTTHGVFVAVYSATRCYGGPEEGGWWYDAGDLEEVFTVKDLNAGNLLREELREGRYPNTGKRGSVLGGEDWEILVFADQLPDDHYPERRPFYE